MRRYVYIFFAWLTFVKVQGQQVINWPGNKNFIEAAAQVSYVEDVADSLTIEKVSAPSFAHQFINPGKQVLHFGLTEKRYWLKISIQNNTGDSLWLELAHAFIPDADLYYADENGKWHFWHSGYKINISNKIIKDHNQLFPLQPGLHDYYIHLQPYVHPIPVRIWKSEAFQVKVNQQRLIYGIYTGILFFAIAINIFLFFALKRNYYLYYSILIFLYALSSAAVLEGYIIYFFPGIDLMYWYKLVPVLDMPALLLYTISILEVKKYFVQLYRVLVFACIYFLIHVLLLHILPLLTALLMNYIYAVVVFILVIYTGVCVGKKKNILGYYFTVAYCIWIILLSLELLFIFTGSPRHLFELSYVSVAIFIESFLLALLLAKRFEWEKKGDEKIKKALRNDIVEMEQRFQQEKMQAQIEIQEQAFEHVSKEIHDNLGQVASVIKINLNTLQLQDTVKAGEKIENTKELVKQLITDLKLISLNLSSDRIKQMGLAHLLEADIERINKTGAFNVQLQQQGLAYRVEPDKETILYRMSQEILNNMVKHSKATVILVLMLYGEKSFILQFVDNGVGFDAKDKINNGLKAGSNGLHNLQKRSTVINAHLTIDSTPGKGTNITIEMPL